ncbi:hypothetical protein [Limnochorda pilosa]|uniref:Uncharacterized protein n=1 Tax=Limnochorda pilosa TaxID=1555112 RepID=A0A0K2SJW4_LIMPI|nr:hypothetical protein [Limnochorda pilosa]BAS27134.1 hypothetical protein LIP_1277 [Limnochorda pilosa]
MPEPSKPRAGKGVDPREANLIGYDSPDDPLTGDEPKGDPESLVALDNPDDAAAHHPYEGGSPPRGPRRKGRPSRGAKGRA